LERDIVAGAVGITALGSGSDGNAFVLHCPRGNYLIDAGFSRKELCARMEKCDIVPESIRAVLISHEHGDHVRGCRVFADAFDIPAYVASAAADYLYSKNQLPKKVVEFISGSSFELPGVSVMPFRVSHDALDPVGFNFTVTMSAASQWRPTWGVWKKALSNSSTMQIFWYWKPTTI
jgi:phosphoribosyl 1,2-cyclic phosphodiesterase